MICKYLKTWTEQQVFDKIVEHLRKQGAKSLMGSDDTALKCAYRGNDNRMCAAGCLIPDDEYSPEIESWVWANLAKNGIVPNNHAHLIWDLQNVHDLWPTEDWERKFHTIAQKYGLIYTPRHIIA